MLQQRAQCHHLPAAQYKTMQPARVPKPPLQAACSALTYLFLLVTQLALLLKDVHRLHLNLSERTRAVAGSYPVVASVVRASLQGHKVVMGNMNAEAASLKLQIRKFDTISRSLLGCSFGLQA